MHEKPAVLHEGLGEVVVVKPAGLSVEGPFRAAAHATESLLDWARTTLGMPEARLPHRIDRMTRGLVLIARDKASCAHHSAMVAAGRWTKIYLARLDCGKVSPDSLPSCLSSAGWSSPGDCRYGCHSFHPS